jgi:bacteriocin biosynthesis cyclodehydratase domain-containing protein
MDVLIRGVAKIAATPLPRQPRLASWLTWVDLGDGRLQARAADFAFTLREPLMVDAVNHLRPLLDGTRTVDEIAVSGGEALLSGTLLFALKVLRQRGVLQEGAPPPALDAEQRRRFEPALRFLSHHVVDAEPVLARLAAARVGLVGDPALCAALRAGLESVGVGHVAERPLESAPDAAPDDLLIAFAATPASGFFEQVNAACLASGARWMRVALEGRLATLGPTIVPEQTACYTCLTLRQAAYDEPAELEKYRQAVRAAGEPDEGRLDPLTATVVAQAVLEAARLLSGFAPAVTFARQHVFQAATPRVTAHEVLRVPRCPSCGRKQSPRDPWDQRAHAGEEGDAGEDAP